MYKFAYIFHKSDQKLLLQDNVIVDSKCINFESAQSIRIVMKAYSIDQLQKIFFELYIQSQTFCDEEPQHFSLIYPTDVMSSKLQQFYPTLVWIGKRLVSQNIAFSEDLHQKFIEIMIQLIEIQELQSDQVQMEFDPLEPWNHFYNLFKYFVPESMVHELISRRINQHEVELYNIGYMYTMLIGVYFKINKSYVKKYNFVNEILKCLSNLIGSTKQMIISTGFVIILIGEIFKLFLDDLKYQEFDSPESTRNIIKQQLEHMDVIIKIFQNPLIQQQLSQSVKTIQSPLDKLSQLLEFYQNDNQKQFQDIQSSSRIIISQVLINLFSLSNECLYCIHKKQQNNILVRTINILKNNKNLYNHTLSQCSIDRLRCIFNDQIINSGFILPECLLKIEIIEVINQNMMSFIKYFEYINIGIQEFWFNFMKSILIQERFSQMYFDKGEQLSQFLDLHSKNSYLENICRTVQISLCIQMNYSIKNADEIILGNLKKLWLNDLVFMDFIEAQFQILIESLLNTVSCDMLIQVFTKFFNWLSCEKVETIYKNDDEFRCSQNFVRQVICLKLLQNLFEYPQLMLVQKFKKLTHIFLQTPNCIWCGRYLLKPNGVYTIIKQTTIHPRCEYCHEIVMNIKINLQYCNIYIKHKGIGIYLINQHFTIKTYFQRIRSYQLIKLIKLFRQYFNINSKNQGWRKTKQLHNPYSIHKYLIDFNNFAFSENLQITYNFLHHINLNYHIYISLFIFSIILNKFQTLKMNNNNIQQAAESSQDLDFNVQIQQQVNQKDIAVVIQPDEQGELINENIQKVPANIGTQNQKQLPREFREAKINHLIQFFHISFKTLAFLFFFILTPITGDSTITFILVVLMDAFDFWTVKNVSGRRLVGLRWWSEIQENGLEVWLYESMDINYLPNECNQSVFWLSQTISLSLWFILTFIDILSMNLYWALLALVGLFTTGVNFFGFYKCRGGKLSLFIYVQEHQQKAKSFASKLGMKAIKSQF